MTPEERARRIKRRAHELGFDACGITDLSRTPHADALSRWLDAGMGGRMSYMRRQAQKRTNPSRIVPGATRAVVVTRNYYTTGGRTSDRAGRIARYARGGDYHATLRLPLDRLVDDLKAVGGAGVIARAFVDAGPVPERELAQRAGIGWIGKNTMLIDPKRGSYFFLATVLTNLDLAVDPPFQADRCGRCTRCLDACPTGAFPQARVLDSRRCIAYLTIEYRGEIDHELADSMGDWVFGCDICQEACPWNEKFAADAADPVLELNEHLACVDLEEMAELPDEEFWIRFGHTPLERPGPESMRRNARVALANSRRNR